MEQLRKYLVVLLTLVFAASVWVTDLVAQPPNFQGGPQQTEASVEEIIESMTLQQKAYLVIGTGMSFNLPDSVESPFGDPLADVEDEEYVSMVDRVHQIVPGAAGATAAFPELGITTQVLADGPAGLRISPTRPGESGTFYATAFPIATVLASSWNTDLVYTVGQAMGEEVLEYGADILLGPGMNLQRDLLCGRNFEYYSEDPLITGKMAAAMISGVQTNGVGTAAKHFAINNQETNRTTVNTIVGQRAERELYLRGFEIAVKEGHPWTIMSSYNKVNGTYTSESYDLLTNILREDWGFGGYVMTDWGGGSDVVAQMEAGNDLVMPGSPQQVQEIVTAVENGNLDESILDRNIARILEVMKKTPKYNGYIPSNNPDLDAHAEVTRQAATEGMVLLENRNEALPLTDQVENVAAFGNGSYEFISGGTGSGNVNEAYTISLIQGLNNAGLMPNLKLSTTYQDYIKETRANAEQPDDGFLAMMRGTPPVAEMSVSRSLAQEMAAASDVALITISRVSGEGGDREPVPGDFYLTDTEKQMITNVSEAFQAEGKKAIVILNVGGAIETATWAGQPDAVLLAWQPGQEAGNSVVDVLTGKDNPSGKLAITFPVRYEDSPTSENFPGHEVASSESNASQQATDFMGRPIAPWEVTYEEGIYVGYRYYNTFDEPVAYEFGYGLSYTDFEFENIELGADQFTDHMSVSVDVTNTGDFPGKEVVQVYLSAPANEMDKPAMELKDFRKTRLLQPGETQTLHFELRGRDLTSFDADASAWVAEGGEYEVLVGASSKDIKGTATFNLSEDRIVEQVNDALAPQVEIDYLNFN